MRCWPPSSTATSHSPIGSRSSSLRTACPSMTSSVDVLSPVQEELGRRWAAGDLGVADEHAASAAVDDLLVRLGATAESPRGPAVVVASAEHDAHALGGRVVASALALEGYRVMFLGASVPAADLADFLDYNSRSRSPSAAPSRPPSSERPVRSRPRTSSAIPVVGGGRALATAERATRLGVDALARRSPATQSRSCERGSSPHRAISPPRLARFPNTRRSPIAATPSSLPRSKRPRTATPRHPSLPTNCSVCCRSSKAALVVEEPALIEEHVQWLRDTGLAHGFALADIDAALAVLAEAMNGDLQRAGSALRAALN